MTRPRKLILKEGESVSIAWKDRQGNVVGDTTVNDNCVGCSIPCSEDEEENYTIAEETPEEAAARQIALCQQNSIRGASDIAQLTKVLEDAFGGRLAIQTEPNDLMHINGLPPVPGFAFRLQQEKGYNEFLLLLCGFGKRKTDEDPEKDESLC